MEMTKEEMFNKLKGHVGRLDRLLNRPRPFVDTWCSAVGDEWILQPEEVYEITGYVHNVVFTCGAVPEDDGSVKIYWGGADKVMCVGTARLDDLVDHCLKNSRKPL